MARIPGLPANQAGVLDRLIYWVAERRFGVVPEPFAVVAHHPRLLRAAVIAEAAYGWADRQLPSSLRNLAVYRVATVVGCSWCVDLLGSGRTELARAIFGADAVEAGELKVDGRPVRFGSPADAIKAGIGLAPEDRKTEGIVPEMSLRENLTLALLPAISRYGIVDRKRQDEVVDRFIRRLDIKTTGPDQKIRELSGGNQQKVLLARWLCLDPRLLLLDEPTRGIDVGAKGEIQALINELADAGLGVLMISSELEELVEGSDRVVVLRDGRTVAELPHEAISEDSIMQTMAEDQATDGEQGRGDG